MNPSATGTSAPGVSPGASPEPGVATCPLHPTRAATATCNRCGVYACEACSQSAEGVTHCAACVARVGKPVVGRTPPWEMHDRGFLDALAATVLQACTDPDRTFASVPSEDPARTPLTYALTVFGVVAAAHTAIGAVIAFVLGGVTEVLAVVVLGWVSLLAYLLLFLCWTGIAHLLARGSGGSTGGAAVSFRAGAYAHSPMILGILPILGHTYAVMWVLVLLAVGLQRSHGTGSRGAALAAIGGAIGTFLAVTVVSTLAAVVISLLVT